MAGSSRMFIFRFLLRHGIVFCVVYIIYCQNTYIDCMTCKVDTNSNYYCLEYISISSLNPKWWSSSLNRPHLLPDPFQFIVLISFSAAA
jgi:hypothetical protein